MNKKYSCGNCGKDFESAKPNGVGPQDIYDFKDGTPVADILIYVCNECYNEIKDERRIY